MKRTKISIILVLALSLMVCPARVNGQEPLTPAFTYQGFLTENGKIVKDDRYDLQFRLFDADVGGNVVGSNDVNDFEVIDGHIAVELDFGGDVFTGDRRWLQISIRKSAVGGNYTPLAPRLELTLTPYALYTLSAEDANTLDGYDANDFTPTGHSHHSLDAADGSPTNVLYVDNAGNVGIGTTSPVEKLEVNGDIKVKNVILGNSDIRDRESVRIIIDRDNDQTDQTFSIWRDGLVSPPGAELFRIQEDGNVGIGTASPTTRLDVNGVITATGGNSNDWNTAFNWGDHAVQGYLIIEDDPQVGTVSNNYVPRWNGSALVTGTIYDNGNVGIGTTSPNSSKGSDGYLDAKDVYLRDSGKWASEPEGVAKVYRSEWFPVGANQTHIKNHELGAYPDIVQVYIAENSDGSGWCYVNVAQRCDHEDTHWNNGVWMEELSGTTIKVRSGDYVTPFWCGWCGDAGTHYCRIVAVKY